MNMQTELVALNLTRQEALECLRACLLMPHTNEWVWFKAEQQAREEMDIKKA